MYFFFVCVASWPGVVSICKLSACACSLSSLTARVFSCSVISLHALRFLGRLGTVETFPPSLSLVILIVFVWLPGRAWSRPENSVHVRACLPLSQLGFFLSVITLHALRFSGWLGTVEIPPHSLFFKFVVSFVSRHTFFHLLPGIWQYISLDHGFDEQSRTYS